MAWKNEPYDEFVNDFPDKREFKEKSGQDNTLRDSALQNLEELRSLDHNSMVDSMLPAPADDLETYETDWREDEI